MTSPRSLTSSTKRSVRSSSHARAGRVEGLIGLLSQTYSNFADNTQQNPCRPMPDWAERTGTPICIKTAARLAQTER